MEKTKMAAKATTIGYTVVSARGTERFTVRAEAERYLISAFEVQPDTADFVLINAYQTWSVKGELQLIAIGIQDVTVTFDGGDKVTK